MTRGGIAAGALLGCFLAGALLGGAGQLAPTDHPQVPASLDRLWFVPATRAPGDLAQAASRLRDDRYAEAAGILDASRLPPGSPLAAYAALLKGAAHLGLDHADTARASFRAARGGAGVGYLAEAAALGEAEADEALGDAAGALAIYQELAAHPALAPDEILLRLANAAIEVGDRAGAVAAYERLYFEHPLSDAGRAAAAALSEMAEEPPMAAGGERYTRELRRAGQLFAAGRYADSRPAFERLARVARGDDRELVDLRLAEVDYYTRRYRTARDRIARYRDTGGHRGEAMFYWALSVRALGAVDAYRDTLRRIAADLPASRWAEDALNELGTHFIVEDDDEEADAVFRELYQRFPTGRHAERAAWKVGWWAYKHGRYAETIRAFEQAAQAFPRSDYRPSWLYWLGRAYDRLGDTAQAQARYGLAVADYRNSYYGRLAGARLATAPPARRLVTSTAVEPAATPPANLGLVRELLAAGLFDQAVNEIRYARAVWGDSVPLQATLAWALGARGDLRAGINAMKRAYPQYMAAGGEELPVEILTVIFPAAFRPIIVREATARRLDPFLVTALVAQESTFDADIRSSANAYGLMQLLPATARRYAPRVGLRYSRGLLTSPEANVRLGTAYLSDLMQEFGEAHLALAAYNAGERRVREWKAERPTLGREEFIDDIPFPETQNYVKRILGTAEDYRRLYGSNPAIVEQQ